MSTDVPAPPPTEVIPDYVTVYGRSNLFYWWPVWATAFVMAGLTVMDGEHMAVVPRGTEARQKVKVEGFDEPRDILVAPAKATMPAGDATAGTSARPGVLVSPRDNLGTIFVAVVVFTALVSTLTFRGLVSVIVIISLLAAVVILALLGLWDDIFAFVGGLSIRINAAGYLAFGVPLLVAWLFTVFVYDKQRYVIFDQGQIRLRLEVGDGEQVIDANGVVVEKLRDDVFRHWLLGLGSGDLQVRAGGVNGQRIEIDNVLWIGSKLGLIQRMLQERQVTAAVASPTVGAAR